jgi:solute carrier family 27 fatty acid transporter 1/4
METRLEYSSMWLGLSKIGCITALINTHLRKETLVHSIRVASSKAIIVSAELLEALTEIIADEEIRKLAIFVYDTQSDEVKMVSSSAVNLHRELQEASAKTIDTSENRPKDKLFYIYTSGTTGLPKAAVITSLRFQFMVSGTAKMFNMSEDEVIYNTLPLYHTGEISQTSLSFISDFLFFQLVECWALGLFSNSVSPWRSARSSPPQTSGPTASSTTAPRPSTSENYVGSCC